MEDLSKIKEELFSLYKDIKTKIQIENGKDIEDLDSLSSLELIKNIKDLISLLTIYRRRN